jgi:gamma-glutamylcyclotransferase (GGCT)/AIG2-like uncharacterized protein YtfP
LIAGFWLEPQGEIMTTSLVFVYGTLLRGEGNHRLLSRARFVGPAMTMPAYRMHSLGGFPGVVAGGSQSIVGEVFEVNEDQLAALDQLEDHPSLYRRQPIQLTDGSTVQTYLLTPRQVAHCREIRSGNWLTHAEGFEL